LPYFIANVTKKTIALEDAYDKVIIGYLSNTFSLLMA